MQLLKGTRDKAEREVTPSAVHVVIPVQVAAHHVAKKKSESGLVRGTCATAKPAKGERASVERIRCRKEKCGDRTCRKERSVDRTCRKEKSVDRICRKERCIDRSCRKKKSADQICRKEKSVDRKVNKMNE